MAEQQNSTTVDRPEPRTTGNVTVPMWAIAVGCLAVGALAGIEAEQGGFTSAVNFRKDRQELTGNTELDKRWLAIVSTKVESAQRRWEEQERVLRAFIDETRCRCRRNGMGGVGDVPVGAAPAPAK